MFLTCRPIVIGLTTLCLLCCAESTQPPQEPPPKPNSTAPSTAPTPPTPKEILISPQGIGFCQIGASEADILAMPGAQKGEYSISFPDQGITVATDAGKVCSVRVKTAEAKTREGLGVGSTFGEFEKAYGSSTVEAATGRIFFSGEASVYDINVDKMPNVGDEKPEASAKVVSIAVDTCPRGPE